MPVRATLLMALLLTGAIPPAGAAGPVPVIAAGQNGYALGPGDRLRITVYNETALTGEYIVTPAGQLAFPLIGDVPAQDRTIDTLRQAIAARLTEGEYVLDPRISVEILAFRPYFILGEVNRPGEYPYTPGLTAAKAVAAAGGYTYRARRKSIFLQRAQSREEPIDLRGAPVALLPGDTIRVGERYF